MTAHLFDPQAQRFGLPMSLLIPIAAVDVAAIQKYVGDIVETVPSGSGQPSALCVSTRNRSWGKLNDAGVWRDGSLGAKARLYPEKQVWVHVDYAGYRSAYVNFREMPAIPAGYVLDHVQNRKAMRLRGSCYPYLRLCPVSRSVNTSGGGPHGGESMEKAYLKSVPPVGRQGDIIYADPMDLTKMLDRPPGGGNLHGVARMQGLFYGR